MTAEQEAQSEEVRAASYQSVTMLRERMDQHEREIKELWRRIHSLSEMIEDRDVH